MKANGQYKNIDKEKLNSSFKALKAIAHPLRIEILNFIGKKGETNVHGIYHVLDIPQSVTSQQLKILKDSKLVIVKKDRKERLYSINLSFFQKTEIALKSFFID
jgi:ArsR family transcriptional regulator